ncbi:MAG: ATPase, T2SS/T4P/T4SS family [bacterium]
MSTRRRIGDVLVENGQITTEQLQEALELQRRSGRRLGEILVELGYLTEEQMTLAMSERLDIPKISLGQMVIDPSVVQAVSVDVARRYTLIPIFEIGNVLTLAMADPLNVIAIDEVRYSTGREIRRAVASPTEIRAAIDEYYSIADSMSHIMGIRSEPSEQVDEKISAEEPQETEAPVVKLVNLIISKAVKEHAADIHIEPEESRIRIRYRVDGIMREEAAPPKSMQAELVSRIKVAADLDVSEKRLPQDGRIAMNVDGLMVDLRISTLPTIHGEKIVIRVLDRRSLRLTFDDLGFNPNVAEGWGSVITKPEGLVLITGPTSSGKTSTLYTTLQSINSIEKNIVTVEDPVEYSLPMVVQVQINEKAGLTFPATLRSMLRQNPDVIMIGEIRDAETAQMAIRSALTGHLVFSTLHTNDAPSAITRLIDMGIEPYLVASALKGVLAQRLVRRNCPECLVAYTPNEITLSRAGRSQQDSGHIEYRKGVGCPQCKNTGKKGLTGVFEFVSVTSHMSEIIAAGTSLGRLRENALNNGYVPMVEMGLAKVADGIICLEELVKQTWRLDTDIRGEHETRLSSTHA